MTERSSPPHSPTRSVPAFRPGGHFGGLHSAFGRLRRRRHEAPARSLARLFVKALVGVVAFWGAYLLVANFATADQLRSLARDADVDVHYRRAYTLYPGHLRVDGVAIASRDGRWSASLAGLDARFDVGALLLAGRRRVTRLHGVGLDARFEPNSVRVTAAPRRGPALMLAAWAGGAAADGVEPVRVEAIRLDVAALALGAYRLGGAARLDVEWLDVGPEQLKVGPAVFTVANGELGQSGETVARGLEARVEVLLAPEDGSAEAEGWARRLSGLAIVDAQLAPAGALQWPGAPLEAWGAGAIRVRLALTRGVVSSESELVARSDWVKMGGEGATALQLPQGVTLRTSRPEGESRLRAMVRAPSVTLGSEGRGDMPPIFEDVEVSLDVGSADLTARGERSGPVIVSAERTRLPGIAASMGALRAELDVGLYDIEAGSVSVRGGTFSMQGLSFDRPGGVDGAPLRATVEVRRGEFSTDGGLSIEGRVHAAGDDAGALLDMTGQAGTARWALGFLEGRPFVLDARVERSAEALVLEDIALEGRSFGARGVYRVRAGAGGATGAALVRYGALSVGVALERGRSVVTLAPPAGWLEARSGERDGR